MSDLDKIIKVFKDLEKQYDLSDDDDHIERTINYYLQRLCEDIHKALSKED